MNRQQFLRTMGGAAASLVPRWASGEELSPPKTITYKRAGGCEIQLDAYEFDPKVKKPVYVYIHGGALITGTKKDVPKWYRGADHVTISLNYRLAPETKLPAIIEDVQDAFRWIHQKGPELLNIDANQLIVAGESAGGYLTLMTAFCVTPRPKALLSVSGYGNIIGTWYSRPDPFYLKQPRLTKAEAHQGISPSCVPQREHGSTKFYLYCRQNGIWAQEVAGHNPDTEAKWFERYCPLRNVSAKYPPTALVHGTADTDVPYSESDDMDKELTRFKVAHKFFSVPNAGHTLSGMPQADKLRIFADALSYVREHLG